MSAHLLALSPALLLLGGLFGGGLLLAVAESVRGPNGITLEHYRNLFLDSEFGVSLLHTFLLSSAATILSTILGFSMALALRGLSRGSQLLRTLVQVPIAVPHLAMAALMLDALRQSGLIARLCFAAGLIERPAQFPELVQDASGIGIILSYTLKETPFIAVVVLAILRRSVASYEGVAATLGASPWQRFRFITLPLAAPGLVSAGLLVFTFVFGAFETPYLLGRPYPAMLGVVVQRRYSSTDLNDRPEAIATGVLMSLACAIFVFAYLRSSSRLAAERPVLF